MFTASILQACFARAQNETLSEYVSERQTRYLVPTDRDCIPISDFDSTPTISCTSRILYHLSDFNLQFLRPASRWNFSCYLHEMIALPELFNYTSVKFMMIRQIRLGSLPAWASSTCVNRRRDLNGHGLTECVSRRCSVRTLNEKCEHTKNQMVYHEVSLRVSNYCKYAYRGLNPP